MKRIVSVILSLCLVAGIVIPSNISNAATYGEKFKYLNNKITLGEKQTFSGTGQLKHGAKSYGGFLTKAKNIKIDYTVESTKPVENGDNLSVTFNVSYKFKNNPKFTKKTVKGYGYGTIEPMIVYSVFDYATGYNLEVKNDKNVVVKQNGETKIKYYKKQNLKHKIKPYKDWYKNKKSASNSFTVTYPKNNGDVCVGIGFINDHGNDWLSYEDGLGKEDGWDSGYYTDFDDNDNEIKKPWKWGSTAYYKRGKKTISYVRLPASESASKTSRTNSAKAASNSKLVMFDDPRYEDSSNDYFYVSDKKAPIGINTVVDLLFCDKESKDSKGRKVIKSFQLTKVPKIASVSNKKLATVKVKCEKSPYGGEIEYTIKEKGSKGAEIHIKGKKKGTLKVKIKYTGYQMKSVETSPGSGIFKSNGNHKVKTYTKTLKIKIRDCKIPVIDKNKTKENYINSDGSLNYNGEWGMGDIYFKDTEELKTDSQPEIKISDPGITGEMYYDYNELSIYGETSAEKFSITLTFTLKGKYKGGNTYSVSYDVYVRDLAWFGIN